MKSSIYPSMIPMIRPLDFVALAEKRGNESMYETVKIINRIYSQSEDAPALQPLQILCDNPLLGSDLTCSPLDLLDGNVNELLLQSGELQLI